MKLFLDDFREPHDVINYVNTGNPIWNMLFSIYSNPNEWVIVTNFKEFKAYVDSTLLKGIDFISLDHDLHPEHYPNRNGESIDYSKLRNPTGYQCAEYLIEFCSKNNIPLPTTVCHSMNIVGGANIRDLLASVNNIE